jgi:hypothetical protein
MVKQKLINSNQKMTNNDNLAHLVYNKALRAQIKEHYKAKYEQRIDYLVGANNELMRELEQWERVRKLDELAPE